MRPGVNVDAVHRLRQRAGAGGHVANVGSLKPRCLRSGCELAAELAEHEVLTPVLDEAEGRGIPERRRSAVADDDLVARRKVEQLGEVRADICDEVLHGRLAVRGAEERRSTCDQRLELRTAHL